jgi:hypothetical protein
MSLNSLGLTRSRLHFKKRSWPSTRLPIRFQSSYQLTALEYPSQIRLVGRTRVSPTVLVARSRTRVVHLTPLKERLPLAALIRIQTSVQPSASNWTISPPSNFWERASKPSSMQLTPVLLIKLSASRYLSPSRMNTSYQTLKLSSKFLKFSRAIPT